MLCIGPPPGLPANCRLPVAARSRPQCRAGVHARRSSLASPHSAANRRLRRFTICPRRTLPPFPATPAFPPPPPPAAHAPRRKTKTAARLFAGPRSPRVFFRCLRRRARMVCRVLPRYASPPSSRRINGTTSLGWMSSTNANSVYSIFSASRMAASSKPESRLPTACRFFLKS